jgi:cysteinyl-tRNA synthetase
MTLKLYNTRTRRKEVFEPFDPKAVRMYVCGPTVYDFAHIGNARPVIVFDVLFRLLRHFYGAEHVTYVRNITDVDDKINARAAEEGVSIRELTERTAAQFHADVAALGALPPTVEPRATEHIPEMIAMIQRLIERGHAYAAEGHVLFNVPSDPHYGELARRLTDEMRAGARVEIAPYKRDPMDFVLWKPSTGSEPGWESPWGYGRPGWHLECSAMSEKHLGDVFDIHGGGIDLLFPHHENEVAQSTCAHGTEIMANFWMHNGHLQVEGQKMSKSLGNFVTIHDLLRTMKFGGRIWDGETIRLAMLKTHYTQPIDWTVSLLEEASRNLEKIMAARYRYVPTAVSNAFMDALCDDLNTKLAIDVLLELAGQALNGNHQAGGELVASVKLIGLLVDDINPSSELGWGVEGEAVEFERSELFKQMATFVPMNVPIGVVRDRIIESSGEVQFPNQIKEELRLLIRYADGSVPSGFIWQNAARIETANNSIDARLAARKARNWAQADRIRDELSAMGISLKDAKNPVTGEIETTWEIAR